MKQSINTLKLTGVLFFVCIFSICLRAQNAPKKMKVGYSIGIQKIDAASMQHARFVGMDCIEVGGFSGLVDKKTLSFKYSDAALMAMAQKVKQVTDAAGIKIWSVHMGFGQYIDLSALRDDRRAKMLAYHKKVLKMVAILRPEIVLFHPSWYLGLDERERRIEKLISSCKVLNPLIKKMGATMVIENMLGPELQKNEKYERPLCRTVEETKMIMKRLDNSIGSAIDMNHIKHPEQLILAMGRRLKTVHIADGTGEAENHYMPCSGEGLNDWNQILSALYQVKYKGPFMFECHYKDEQELTDCYEKLYGDYIQSL